MKYFALTLLAVAMLGAAAPAVSKNVTITVNGESTISRPPDTATVSLQISTTSDVAQTATTENNSRYNDLRNRMRAIGVQDDAIRTVSYNVTHMAPQPEMGAPQPQSMRPAVYPYPGPRPAGYTVSRSLQVKLTDLELVGKAVDAAVAANVSDIYNVQYTISNYRALYAQALKEAVQDAQRQATSMASAANLRIVRISAMQTEGSYGQPAIMRAMAPAAVKAPPIPTEIQPGPVDVQARVTVTYVLAP